MSVPPPLPEWYVGLALALPGVWLLARSTASSLTRERSTRVALSVGLAISLWVLAVHACSLAAGSFRVGLPVATLSLAIAGLFAASRSQGPNAEGAAPSGWMWLTMIASALCVSRAAVGWFFHDELLPVGHLSIASEIENGFYPPRNLMFPDLPLRYHLGFDLLVASLGAIFRLRVDHAIDAATLGLWCASWCLAWELGARLGQGRFAWLTPVLVLFGGGLPIACETAKPSLAFDVLVECRVGKIFSLNAPVISYFFQHPWGLGLPMLLTATLVLLERRASPARLAVLGLLLAALSSAEVVIFAGLLPAAVVVESVGPRATALPRGARMLAVVALALGGAKLMGGFLASAPGLPALRFQLHAGYTDTLRDTVGWNLRTFGVLGAVGVAGALLAPRSAFERSARLLFALLAAGSVVLVNGVRYTGSHDMLKFATLASVALGVLAAMAIARFLEGARLPVSARGLVASAVLLGAAGEGLLFLAFFVLDRPEIPDVVRRVPEALDDDDLAAVLYLRPLVRGGDLVYRVQPAALGYQQWGGLPVPWVDWTARAFGVPRERIAARLRLQSQKGDVDAYRAEGFRWLVVDPHDEAMSQRVDSWIAENRARTRATFGRLRVVELGDRQR